jgi:hypothetical protein
MIAGAIVGVVLAGTQLVARMSRLAASHRRRAAEYARYEAASLTNVAFNEDCEVYWRRRLNDPRAPEKIKWCLIYARMNRHAAAHHGQIRRKWEYLASHPWLPAGPDPVMEPLPLPGLPDRLTVSVKPDPPDEE